MDNVLKPGENQYLKNILSIFSFFITFISMLPTVFAIRWIFTGIYLFSIAISIYQSWVELFNLRILAGHLAWPVFRRNRWLAGCTIKTPTITTFLLFTSLKKLTWSRSVIHSYDNLSIFRIAGLLFTPEKWRQKRKTLAFLHLFIFATFCADGRASYLWGFVFLKINVHLLNWFSFKIRHDISEKLLLLCWYFVSLGLLIVFISFKWLFGLDSFSLWKKTLSCSSTERATGPLDFSILRCVDLKVAFSKPYILWF